MDVNGKSTCFCCRPNSETCLRTASCTAGTAKYLESRFQCEAKAKSNNSAKQESNSDPAISLNHMASCKFNEVELELWTRMPFATEVNMSIHMDSYHVGLRSSSRSSSATKRVLIATGSVGRLEHEGILRSSMHNKICSRFT